MGPETLVNFLRENYTFDNRTFQLIEAVVEYAAKMPSTDDGKKFLRTMLCDSINIDKEDIDAFDPMGDGGFNTEVRYLYRDSSNYKTHKSVVVAGQITEDQIDKILNACEDGGAADTYFFMPGQVGLPDDIDFEADPCEDDDGMFEIDEFSFEATNSTPTIPMTVEQLVAAFEENKGKWEPMHFEDEDGDSADCDGFDDE